MEPYVIAAILICAIIFIPPVILFRPLVVALANRIAGKRSDANQVKQLQDRVSSLEAELSHANARMLALEEGQEFIKKLEAKVGNEPRQV